MEFQFNCEKLLRTNKDGFVVLIGKEMSGYAGVPIAPSFPQRFGGSRQSDKSDQMSQIASILDRMGDASSKAQQLPQTITTMGKFSGTNQRLYIKASGNTVQGLLKVGERTIFYRNYAGACKELQPLCVLDFYVHESLQRQGVGNTLFYYMLQQERVMPNKIAYDRPSPKLLKFLDKHYGLKNYIQQNNNFVIYEAYWNSSYSIPDKTLASLEEYGMVLHKEEKPNARPPASHYFEEASASNARPVETDVSRPSPKDYSVKNNPKSSLTREEENDIKEAYNRNLHENRLKMAAHVNPNKKPTPFWEEAPATEQRAKQDIYRNTYSGPHTGQKQPAEISRPGLHGHPSLRRLPDALGVAGTSHYDQKSQKEQTSLPSISKSSRSPPTPDQVSVALTNPLLPDPSVPKNLKGKTSHYERELSALE